MRRTTIDFGIDLGTTNSTIAVVDGIEPKVITNKMGSVITPSAVYIDKRGQTSVGVEARQRALVTDPTNGVLEFKQRMGMGGNSGFTFANSGRTMSPEELSAEVLKSLRIDVRTSLGEEIRAAVVTVPAAFEKPATAATQRAGSLAGLDICPLLLEPVAASLAYGFQTEKDNVYWLVYDFGGGTFDAAVMRIRDGFIHVENHAGDNQLGGKLLDWDIVTERLIPAARDQAHLPNLRRDNPRYALPLLMLKHHAEAAKIEVCRTRARAEIYLEGWCEDERGNSANLQYWLTPDDIEDISRPYIARTLNLCRKTLVGANIPESALERVLMVGGSTLNPWIRDAVEVEIGRPLDFSIDPITVVARGAAIFASTVELRKDASSDEAVVVPTGAWRIEIELKPAGSDQFPTIGGIATSPEGTSAVGNTIELFDPATRWRSGRITLGANGVFMTELYAATPGRHHYQIELCDSTGTALVTEPKSVAYTYMLVEPTAPPLLETLGVGLANGNVALYLKKGEKLPARKMLDHTTVVTLRAGNAQDVLRIPLLEGEHDRAERNRNIGVMEINGAQLTRDLPQGRPIEISVSVDASQSITLSADIPDIEGAEFSIQFEPIHSALNLNHLTSEFDNQKERLAKIRSNSNLASLPGAKAILARIADENLLGVIATQIQAAVSDPGALSNLDLRLRELAALIDDLEDAQEWPNLVERATESRKDTEKAVESYGQDDDRRALRILQGDFERAIEIQNVNMVRRAADDFDVLYFTVLDRVPAYHITRFERLVADKGRMTDQNQAEQVIAQGRRAVKNDDVDTLKAVNRQLRALLPTVASDDRVKHANIGDTL